MRLGQRIRVTFGFGVDAQTGHEDVTKRKSHRK